MTRSRRLFLPALLGVVLASLLAASPGRAQDDAELMRAGADSTLLRDTLGLSFPRLFTLADSLAVMPDSLRALSVRYRWSLTRLITLADSLELPMVNLPAAIRSLHLDRTGPRARYETRLQYNSTYNIQQNSTSWGNVSDLSVLRNLWDLSNQTNVQIDEYRSSSRRETRSSVTEVGWRATPGISLGGRANLDRFNSYDPGSTNNQGETKDEFQLSVKSRHQPSPGLRTSFNVYGGYLDVQNYEQVKRGASGDVNGTVRLATPLVTHDLSGQVTGNLARTRKPTASTSLNTNDLSNNLRGTLGLFPSWPVGLNVTYSLRRIRVETPGDTSITQVRTRSGGVDATLRFRLDNDRSLNVTGSTSTQSTEQGGVTNSQSNRNDRGLNVNGRYLLVGWTLEGTFGLSESRSEYPTRTVDGGYGESLRVANIDASATRRLGTKLRLRGNGSASLNASRYYQIGNYKSTPANKDSYRQYYKLELQYTASPAVNSSVGLSVTRNVLVNIPVASKSGNNELRSYDVEWRWSYRILPGLTASQTNALGADYTHYYYLPTSDKLSLDYNVATTLNAVFSPRFSLDVRHSARHQPSGTYGPLADGITYLSRSEVNDNYTLSARMSYSPTSALSFNLQPNYTSGERDGSQGGTMVRTRNSRQLNFSGGVSLNLPVGTRGRLTGDLQRTYRDEQSLSYTSKGELQSQVTTGSDYWNGSLQFSWQL
jgi:hypothetical protein